MANEISIGPPKLATNTVAPLRISGTIGSFRFRVRAQMRGSDNMRLTIPIAIALLCAGALTALPAPARGADSNAQILRRLEALECENQELRGEVDRQRREFEDFKGRVRTTSESQSAQVSELRQKVAASSEQVPELKNQIERVRTDTPVKVGFRTGWAESPYDMPGGFFYGAYLADRLLTSEDGIPYGYVSGELMAGVVLGNHTQTTANLVGQLTGVPSYSYMDNIEIEPTAQYHLDLASLGLTRLEGVRPYVLAGPGIWVTTLATPLNSNAQVPGSGFRHTDADVQPGGVFGGGIEVSLGGIYAPAIQRILNRLSIEAEWRYNLLGNGEGFNQYTSSIAIGF